jgi:glycosyltransferase involved in cell wall biosynthesis
MAAGCLVLGSANPPVDEVIRDGENGYLVDAFNVEAVSQQIVAALEDPQRAQDLRRSARASVVEQHDLKTQILPRWLKLLEELTSSDSQEVV